MKFQLLIIMFVVSVACFAQLRKDSIITAKKDTVGKAKLSNESKEILTIENKRFLRENMVLHNIYDTPYVTDFQKPSLKEVIGKSQRTDKDIAEGNMNDILADIRRSTEDKRSGFLKVMQSALEVVQTAVVVGLAVREVTRKKD